MLACEHRRNQVFSQSEESVFAFEVHRDGGAQLPTPFFIYFFIAGLDPFNLDSSSRFLLVSTLLLSGAIVGVASYYKDSAVAALKDWYPSDKAQ